MKASIFIVSPLVGAGIGYITNWIAIKMLFRPIKPVRIFGKEISSLQGVIPKRHKDLARSIGKTVGEHLLTEDAFQNILETPETRERIRKLVQDGARHLQKEERTVDELLEFVIPDFKVREEMFKELSDYIVTLILEIIRSEKTIEVLERYLTERIFQDKEEFLSSDYYQKLKYDIREYLLTGLKSPIVLERINLFLHTRIIDWQNSEKQLKNLIPKNIVNGIKAFLLDQGPKFTEQIMAYLTSAETKSQIKKRIDQFFDQSLLMGLLGKFFADRDKIAEQLINQIADFINDPLNQYELLKKINDVIDTILDTRVSELANRIDEKVVLSISEFLFNKMTSREFIDNCLDNLENLILTTKKLEESICQAAVVQEVSFNSNEVLESKKTGRFIRQLLIDFLNADFVEKVISKLIKDQLRALRQQQVKSFFANLKLTTIKKVENGVLDLLNFVNRNYLGKIINAINFDKLVEEKVLSFELEEMEALVLQVMSVELRAITLFGFYLGLLMGFVTPLINLLFG
ncbi:hypothetical protein BBF96_07985 [Anoxybacter fermentans]|uniref:DUF445 domain-containing protein n=1 Tax=Anoxybacter fermentans TaxID=1323375 RepID=A0A3Q9HQR8_9FIRM|nr:DUF445 family protein [Anoxybacter fermentans]AZR73326.1 hypothetical protein BBF96_07985 [Anoxybacter fermentans]